MNILKVTFTKYNKLKYIKTFEDIDEFNLDDVVTSNTSQEEDENVISNENSSSIESSLNECINDCQQFINMYNAEQYKDMLKIAETAVEFSQVCLNSIKRNYGPIEEIKSVTKKVLNQCATDFKKNENIEMSMQCADKCSNASNIL